jgi:site-specific DNA-methyltransferase (adenine-specific)
MLYTNQGITVSCEDNMQLMARYPDNYFDLAFIDPEYGIGESSKNHKSRNTPIKQKNGNKLKAKDSKYSKKNWDHKPPDDGFFKEIKRVSINQVIFGANYFKQIIHKVDKPPRRNEYDIFIKENPKGYIIWDKVNGNNDFSDCEIIYTSYNFDSFIVYYMWNGMMQGLYVSTDLQKALIQIGNKSLNEKRLHPTQKPLKLIKWLFNFLKIFNFKVLDTNTGLMATVITSIEAKCEIVACDKEIEYFQKGIKRVKNHLSEPTLF